MFLKAEIDNNTQYARENHGRTHTVYILDHLMEGNVRKGSTKSLFSKSPCIHVTILGSTVTRGSVRCHDRSEAPSPESFDSQPSEEGIDRGVGLSVWYAPIDLGIGLVRYVSHACQSSYRLRDPG